MKTPSELFDTPPTSGPVFDALASKKILSAIEWLNQEYPHPHGGFVIPSPEMVEAYAAYCYAEISKPPKDVVEAIKEKYPYAKDAHLLKMGHGHITDVERIAALYGYSLAAVEKQFLISEIMRLYEFIMPRLTDKELSDTIEQLKLFEKKINGK